MQIVDGAKTVKKWYGKSIPHCVSLNELFSSFSSGEMDNGVRIPDKYNGCKMEVFVGAPGITIDAETSVGDATAVGIYITFRITSGEQEETCEASSSRGVLRPCAFEMLMSRSRDKIYLPDRVTNIRGNKDRLMNSIIDWMEKNNLFFQKQSVDTVGNELSSALTNVFWYIDGHGPTLSFSGFNKPGIHRHRKRETSNLDCETLKDHSAILLRSCASAYMKTVKKESPWYMLRKNVLQLADNLRKHADYLDHQKEIVTKSHERKVQYEWEVYEPSEINSTLTARYKQINKALQECAPYFSIFLNDFTPTDASRKYDFLKGLRFEMKVIRCSYTSSREHLHFVWKVHPEDNESTVLQKNDEISSALKAEFPKYFSRAMKRDFVNMFG